MIGQLVFEECDDQNMRVIRVETHTPSEAQTPVCVQVGNVTGLGSLIPSPDQRSSDITRQKDSGSKGTNKKKYICHNNNVKSRIISDNRAFRASERHGNLHQNDPSSDKHDESGGSNQPV